MHSPEQFQPEQIQSGFGGVIDGAVRRIEQGYEVRGMVQTVTSYSAASGGTVVNDVAFTYNDFAQLTIEQQELRPITFRTRQTLN
jgi:hypothetical protein